MLHFEAITLGRVLDVNNLFKSFIWCHLTWRSVFLYTYLLLAILLKYTGAICKRKKNINLYFSHKCSL